MKAIMSPRSDTDHGLAEVDQALDQLETADQITPADLDAFRDSLPTDPTTARIVNRALPWPWGDLFEYVSPAGNGRQAGYWRVSPDRSTPRSDAEAQHREAFRAAAREARGSHGTVPTDDGEIPRSAAIMAERLSDRDAASEDSSDTGARALQRLRALLGDE